MKKIIETLNGVVHDTPPVWLMRQAGRYLPEYLKTRAEAGSFLELCYNPRLATEVTMQPIRRYDLDAAILFSDILVVPHALGQDVGFAENHGPVLGDLPEKLAFERDSFHKKLEPVYQAVEGIKAQLQAENFSNTALIGFSGSPWTLACYMIDKRGSKDFMATRLMALAQPEKFAQIIDVLVEAISAYLCEQIRRGAEIVQLFDSWAGVLSPDQFDIWVIKPTQKIIANIRKLYPATPIIGFPKGAGFKLVDYVQKTGVNAVSLDSQVPLIWAKDVLQPLVTVQGNLDPVALIAGGKALSSSTNAILEAFKGRPYIFNLGHGIDKSTPPDHVAALIRQIRG